MSTTSSIRISRGRRVRPRWLPTATAGLARSAVLLLLLAPACSDQAAKGNAIETTCTGGVDDDGDGLIDCADPDCIYSLSCAGNSDGGIAWPEGGPAQACGGQSFQAARVEPNVLFVLDRSGSMNEKLVSGSTKPADAPRKMDVARQALDHVLALYGSQIRAGLVFLPGCPSGTTTGTCTFYDYCDAQGCLVWDSHCFQDTSQCDRQEQYCGPECTSETPLCPVDAPHTALGCTEDATCTTDSLAGIAVAPGPGSTAAVQQALPGVQTCFCKTPLALTVASLVGTPSLADTERPSYVVLMTDGAEYCGGEPAAEVGRVYAQTPPVKTIVIGFGELVDAKNLAAMAEAGGTAGLAGKPYFSADNATSLEDAFRTTVHEILDCTLTLDKTPPNPDELYVFVNDRVLPPDGADGWSYDAKKRAIVLEGASCEQLRLGNVQKVDIVMGCPNITLY